MIRMVLFAIGFAMITVALLVFQPGLTQRADTSVSEIEPVTRADPGLSPGISQSLAIVPAPVDQTLVAVPSTAPMDDHSLRKMTWDTLSGLNHATGRETAPGQPGSLLHTIVQRSLDDTAPGSAAPSLPRSAPAAAAPQAAAPVSVYIVRQGDSLVSIAQSIYGDVNMTGPLFAANRDILTRPDNLRPGQELTLPNR